jgi:hypothetical protein
MSQRDRIKVVCRIRPENKLEKEGNYQKCVTYEDYAITVNVSENEISQKFHVFHILNEFGMFSAHRKAK